MQSAGNNFVNTNIIKGILDIFISLGSTLDDLTTKNKGLGIAVGLLTAAFIACSIAIKTMGLASFETMLAGIPERIVNIITGMQGLDNIIAVTQYASEGLMTVLADNPLTWIGIAIASIISITNDIKKNDDAVKQLKTDYDALKKATSDNNPTELKNDIPKVQADQTKLDKLKKDWDNSKKHSSNAFGMIFDAPASTQAGGAYNGYVKQLEQAGIQIDKTTGKIKGLKDAKDQLAKDNNIDTATRELSESQALAGNSTGKLMQDYIKLSEQIKKGAIERKQQTDDVNALKKIYPDLSSVLDKNGDTVITSTKLFQSHAEALITDANNAKNNQDQQDALASTMTDSIDKIKDYAGYIKNMDKNSGHLSATDAKNILKNHQELLPYLNNEPLLYKKIKEAIDDEQKTANETYSNLLKNNEDYYKNNTTLKNSIDGYIDEIYSKYKSFFTVKAEAMKNDVNNASSAAQAELKIETDLIKAKSQAEKAYYQAKEDANNAEGTAELQMMANPLQVAINSAGVNGKSLEEQAKSRHDVQQANDKANQAKQKWDEASKALSDAQAGFDKIINGSTKLPDTLANTSEGDESTSKSEEAAKKANEAQEKQLEGQVKNIEAQKKAYDDSADASYKAEQQQEDAIIKGYQTQLDELQKKKEIQEETNELLKDQNDIIKAQQDLQNAQQEKVVRIYENGQWVWSSDQQKLDTAESALVDAQQALREKQADDAEKAQEDDLNAKIKAEQDKKDAYETNYQNAKDATDKSYQDQEDSLNNQKENLQGYADGTDDVPRDDVYDTAEGDRPEIIIPKEQKTFLHQGDMVVSENNTEKILNKVGNQSSSVATNQISQNTKKVLNDVNKEVTNFANESPKYAKNTEHNIGQSVTDNKKLIRTPITNLKNEITNEIQQFIDGSGQYSVNTNKNIGTAIDTSKKSVTLPTSTLISDVRGMINDFVKNEYNDGVELNTQLGQGITDSEKDLTKTIDDLCQKIIDEFKKDLGIHSPSTVAHQLGIYFMQGFINGLNDSDIESLIAEKMSGMVGAAKVNLPGDVTDWLKQAMSLVGAPDDWLPALQTLVSKESGGDPNEINSAPVGNEHATGLLQTLPSTFQEYMLSGHSNILNAVDNASAALKYIMERYGSPYNIPNLFSGNYIGYQNGTSDDGVPTNDMYKINEDTREGSELVFLPEGTQVINSKRSSILKKLADTLGSNGLLSSLNIPNLGINVPNINIPSNINLNLKNDNSNVKPETHIHMGNIVLPNVKSGAQLVSELEQIVDTME